MLDNDNTWFWGDELMALNRVQLISLETKLNQGEIMSVRSILFIEHSNSRYNLFILMTYSYLTILQLTKI